MMGAGLQGGATWDTRETMGSGPHSLAMGFLPLASCPSGTFKYGEINFKNLTQNTGLFPLRKH